MNRQTNEGTRHIKTEQTEEEGEEGEEEEKERDLKGFSEISYICVLVPKSERRVTYIYRYAKKVEA